ISFFAAACPFPALDLLDSELELGRARYAIVMMGGKARPRPTAPALVERKQLAGCGREPTPERAQRFLLSSGGVGAHLPGACVCLNDRGGLILGQAVIATVQNLGERS